MSDAIRANKRRSALMVASFVVFVALIGAGFGYLFGNGPVFALVALLLGGALAFVSYRTADRIALSVSRARPVTQDEYPRLHNVVEGLCMAGGLPKPGIYVIEDPAPNAFATGRNPNHASIALTSGLLDQLSRVELEGVVAHELSHIRNYDILASTMAVTMVGAVALATDLSLRTMWWNGGRVPREGDRDDRNNPVGLVGFFLLLVSPLVAGAMRIAVSRRRETMADVAACQLTRYPPGLISALEKISADTCVTHGVTTATAHLWLEQPMSGVGDAGKLRSIHQMYDTHAPLDERIALLREL